LDNQSLYEHIINQSKKECEDIIKSANKEANIKKSEIISKRSEQLKDDLINIENQYKSELTTLSNKASLKKLQEISLHKRNIIDSIFDNLYSNLCNLEGDSLLNFVEQLLLNETLDEEETILVSSKEYDKYRNALISKPGNICDKLNKKHPKTKFILSKVDANITSGFIITKPNYDLSFSFSLILEKEKDRLTDIIIKELFNE
jgi:vacuolar-type H+-ATPase subunit E/Vma4